MEDGHSLFDYSVGLNDLIQIMVRNPQPVKQTSDDKTEDPKHNNGYSSSGEESNSSDKENKQVNIWDKQD